MTARTGTTFAAKRLAFRRRGVTLIELLIVMTIMLMITSVALRTMSADTKGRRQREAARAISIYLGVARSRAMESGRPCGVRFESTAIRQVKTPATVAGGSTNATCTVTVNNGVVTVSGVTAAAGDLVQINGQGWYISGGGSSLVPYGTFQPPPGTSQPVPYRVLRKPEVNNAVPPLQLPRGTGIDLSCSGDDYGTAFTAGGAVTVTFAPNGAIAGVWNGNNAVATVNPIYLLVGRPDVPNNWKTFENFWIAIRPQTGLVTVAGVAAQDTPANSRKFAREGLAKGGR